MNLGDIASKLGREVIFPLMNLFDKKEGKFKVYKDPFGYEIVYRNKSLDKLVITEQYKLGEYSEVEVKEGYTVIDIGGHIGTSSIAYARQVGKTGKVYSIEADPSNYDILKINKERNKIENLFLYNLALVGDKNLKEIDIIIDGNNTAGHSLYESKIDTSIKVKVQAKTLIDFCKDERIEKIDILHMDIEGGEFDIFFNTPKDFLNNINQIVFEYHDLFNTGHTHEELLEMLDSMGYEYSINIGFLPKALNLGTGVVFAKKK